MDGALETMEAPCLCEIPVLELARNANFFKPLDGSRSSSEMRFHAYRWCFSMSVQARKKDTNSIEKPSKEALKALFGP